MDQSDPCRPQPPRPDSCTLVLFGATGDLTRRKLVPALYSLSLQRLLPERFAILAFARRPKDDAQFRQDLREAVREFAPGLPSEGSAWDRFASRAFYQRGRLDSPEDYLALRDRLESLERQERLGDSRLYYLATPPEHFAEVVRHLGESGLARPDDGAWTRIIVEKPFGSDLESARQLNRQLRQYFAEEQIYRIDHYLGKETVQNILVLRFANSLFELLWSHLYVDNVQITVAETLGMEGRGAYYDAVGAARDVVQNHALQLLTLIAMEPPVSLEADRIRDEKVKVLHSMRPIADARRETVRGQYAAGTIGGRTVPAYQAEEGVPPGSRTETFTALRLWVDNWRWAGVPFYIRAGKRLATRETKVALQLREVPDVLFARLACGEVTPNRITIRIQPNEGVEILMSAKEPGPAMIVSPVPMEFSYREVFGSKIPDAYERLLLNAMLGEASLFARADEVEAAWGLVTPIIQQWSADPRPPEPYAAGTWGPEGADRLLRDDGRCWWS